MQIQVETDNHIEASQGLTEHVQTAILNAVGHHREHLTHVEAHLGSDNGNADPKSGLSEVRCTLEARVVGLKNLAVSHQAQTLHLAIDGAATKLQRALASSVGKLQDKQRHAGVPEFTAPDLEG